jgi:hypothetical protein
VMRLFDGAVERDVGRVDDLAHQGSPSHLVS